MEETKKGTTINRLTQIRMKSVKRRFWFRSNLCSKTAAWGGKTRKPRAAILAGAIAANGACPRFPDPARHLTPCGGSPSMNMCLDLSKRTPS